MGWTSSGKTSLLLRFVGEIFRVEGELTTIGIDLKSCTVKINEDKLARLQIWDTSGQETYFSYTRSYFRGCQGALLVFDITNKESFEKLRQTIKMFREECPEKSRFNIVIVGNKIDSESQRKVSK